ncbi:MAG TPA: tetratricopeptide repeat protein, partial [Bacteroidia bacterium]|jgi:tetratricopeptide (TPR) repeat protein|nr:tetratricopeptide repeat protein [Bacteroidia bacterium]
MEFEYLFFDGAREKVLGNYESAEGRFLQALKLDPSSSATMYELATIYTFQNNKSQALLYSKKAATAAPKNTWYQLLYAECLRENKKPTEAAAVYEKLLQNFPDRLDFYYELANAYLFANKPNDAIKTYNRIEQQIGVSEDASMQKIKIYKSLNNTDKAIEEAKKLIAAFPKEGKYYGIIGELYQEKGQNEKALQAYNDLLRIDPENAYVHLSLADYYRNQKQNEKSFEEIKIAFKSKLLDIDTKIKILLSYYSITETYSELKADADELCKILVEVHPDEAKAFSMYGDFLYRDKKLEQARIEYRKSIALDKEKYALWNQLLIIESELNDYAAMEKESKEAIELFPNQALPYFFNGAANLQLRNYQASVDVLTEGKEFAFDKQLLAQFYANIGDAQNQLKKFAASDSAYNKALELEPGNVYVLNNYAYYLSIRNENLEKAERMSKKTNELEPNNNSYQDTYGWILYQMKKYDDAKIWVGKALDNGGKTNGTLLEHYGDILYQLGDKENAVKYWQDAKKAGGASDLLEKKIMEKKLYE